MSQALTTSTNMAVTFANKWRQQAPIMGELIPLPVREPFAAAPVLVCAARPPVTFAEVWGTAFDCFAEALSQLSEGLALLWLYFRVWLAALRRDVREALARQSRSLRFAWCCGSVGWGAFLTLFALELVWR